MMTSTESNIEVMDDGNLVIYNTRWGTYQARDKEGNGLCSGVDRDAVIFWGREHLNGFQNSYMTVTDTRFTGKDTL